MRYSGEAFQRTRLHWSEQEATQYYEHSEQTSRLQPHWWCQHYDRGSERNSRGYFRGIRENVFWKWAAIRRSWTGSSAVQSGWRNGYHHIQEPHRYYAYRVLIWKHWLLGHSHQCHMLCCKAKVAYIFFYFGVIFLPTFFLFSLFPSSFPFFEPLLFERKQGIGFFYKTGGKSKSSI